MDPNMIALALLKALNGGSLPTAGVDFTQALTQAERDATQGAGVRFIVDYPNPTRPMDGTATIHVSLMPSNVPVNGVTGSV